jgi:methyltransferase
MDYLRFSPLSEYVFLTLFILTIIQRLAELLRSKYNQSSLKKEGFTRADSSYSYSFMVIVHSSWFLAMLVEHFYFSFAPPVIVQLIACTCFLLAQGLRLWTLRSLGMHWNVNVMTPSKSTLIQGFVRSGPYRFIRHPNYLSVIVEIFCLPVLGGAYICALLWSILNGIVLWFRINEEEQQLFTRPGYSEEMGSLPRLIPFRLNM